MKMTAFLIILFSIFLHASALAVPDFGPQPLLAAHHIEDYCWLADSSALAVNTDRGLVLVEPSGPRPLLDVQGAVSPNGDSIVFSDPSDGTIRVERLSDGATTNLGYKGSRPAWSPDSARIAFYATGACTAAATGTACLPAGLVSADMETGDVQTLVSGADPGGGFAWLGSASGVVYYNYGELGIARLDAATHTVVTRAATFPQTASGTYMAPVAVAAAAPRAAAFLFADTSAGAEHDAGQVAALWIFDTDTGETIETVPRAWYVGQGDAHVWPPPRGITWRPDGVMLAYVGRDREGFHLTIEAPGQHAQPVVYRFRDRPALPRWSPDGTALAYVLVRSGESSQAGALAELRMVRFVSLEEDVQ